MAGCSACQAAFQFERFVRSGCIGPTPAGHLAPPFEPVTGRVLACTDVTTQSSASDTRSDFAVCLPKIRPPRWASVRRHIAEARSNRALDGHHEPCLGRSAQARPVDALEACLNHHSTPPLIGFISFLACGILYETWYSPRRLHAKKKSMKLVLHRQPNSKAPAPGNPIEGDVVDVVCHVRQGNARQMTMRNIRDDFRTSRQRRETAAFTGTTIRSGMTLRRHRPSAIPRPTTIWRMPDQHTRSDIPTLAACRA